MFLECIYYIRATQQMNQILKITVQCVHHSVKPQPSVYYASDNRSVDDLLVKILPAGAHSVFDIVQVGNRSDT